MFVGFLGATGCGRQKPALKYGLVSVTIVTSAHVYTAYPMAVTCN